jgi:hypothetical protein
MFHFLRTRQWIVTRRLILVGIVLILFFRSYGTNVLTWMRGPNPQRDIAITRAEFRADVPTEKPVWIIGFRNNSSRYAYDQIQLEANYFDGRGAFLQSDKLLVRHRLAPGQEEIIGSPDAKERGAATRGTLKVLDAKKAN